MKDSLSYEFRYFVPAWLGSVLLSLAGSPSLALR
jgi:hypothetical protein